MSENGPDENAQHAPINFTWQNFHMPELTDWIQALCLLGQAGSPSSKTGLAYYVFAVNRDMPANEAFYSSDGDFLIVLQNGILDIQSELGHIYLQANEIAVIPRGIRYRVTLPHGPARGYVLELYQGHFQLPELGPIGSCGLANVRDFQVPIASFQQDNDTEWSIVTRYNGKLFVATQDHTPFDVVAWNGSYYPYKYDLGRFNTVGSVSYDHPDPSISTVLTAPSNHPGSAVVDFAIFPPRWEVMEDTYRMPYFHRNIMSEFVGIICPQDGCSDRFFPFGGELINCMVPHGVERKLHDISTDIELRPSRTQEGVIRFMFESSWAIGVADWAVKSADKPRDVTQKSPHGFRVNFNKISQVKS
jgi:homogentisate 1,2-dioxygenase